MLSCEIIGFLGSDAKKPKKVVLLTYLINIEKKEQIKPYGVSCFLNYETKIMDFLKTGTPVYVNGDITISTYSS